MRGRQVTPVERGKGLQAHQTQRATFLCMTIFFLAEGLMLSVQRPSGRTQAQCFFPNMFLLSYLFNRLVIISGVLTHSLFGNH